MFQELFEAVDKLKTAEQQMKEASEDVDRKLQDMQNYINEYLQITQNVFGSAHISKPIDEAKKPVPKKEIVSIKSKPSKKRRYNRSLKRQLTREERLSIVELITEDGLRPVDVAKKFDLKPAYVYNLVSDYRHGRLDLKTTNVVTKDWIK